MTACAVRAIFLSLLQGDAFTCKASPLPKQSTGLFGNSPLAKRPTECGALPHALQGLSALDLTKGVKPL